MAIAEAAGAIDRPGFAPDLADQRREATAADIDDRDPVTVSKGYIELCARLGGNAGLGRSRQA